MDNNEEDIEIIDTKWIDDFEKEESKYLSYYNENISYLKVFYIYINTESEIHKIKEEKIHLLVENCITKNELIGLIKNNVVLDNIKYSLLLLLKYNVLLKPNELKYFLKTNNTTSNITNNYLTSVVNIENILFEKTITMFHDINSLFIIFYQKPYININNNNNNNNSNIRSNYVGNSVTKKIFINKLHKLNSLKKKNKTIKKTT